MQTTQPIFGHSLPLNTLFVVLNILGFGAIVTGFLNYFEAFSFVLIAAGIFTAVATIVLLFLFKGLRLMAVVSRLLVGSLFIVSGLIKANDTKGFSYKLEEYFQDGALAYRIKEWFGAPSFSLEVFIQYALVFSIVICIIEIVIGVLVILGGKMRLMSWLLIPMMLFFTFLTWHTATCNAKNSFKDRDTYALSSVEGQQKIDEAKTNHTIKIIQKNSDKIVVEEMKSPQCVTDCGCFGDAMKGSVGRSLTPLESLWKDLILLYFIVWIFITQKAQKPNSVKQNWIYIPVSLLLIAGLSWVFDWYFMVLFAILSFLGSLLLQSKFSKLLGSHTISALFITLLSASFIWFTLTFDPMKDYRAYAVGNLLPSLTKDGKPGVYQSILKYKNKKTGEIVEYDSSSKAYFDSNIWDKTDEWKYLSMENKEIVPTKLPSIDTNQFNPIRLVQFLNEEELSIPFIQRQMKHKQVPGFRLKDIHTNMYSEIAQDQYHEESYPSDTYQIVDTLMVENSDLQEVSIRDYLFTAPKILVLFSNNLSAMNTRHIQEYKSIFLAAKKDNTPFIMVVNATENEIEEFQRKFNFRVPVFVNDGLELKVVSRINPSLMVLRFGRVKGKYSGKSLPKYTWIKTNLLKK